MVAVAGAVAIIGWAIIIIQIIMSRDTSWADSLASARGGVINYQRALMMKPEVAINRLSRTHLHIRWQFVSHSIAAQRCEREKVSGGCCRLSPTSMFCSQSMCTHEQTRTHAPFVLDSTQQHNQQSERVHTKILNTNIVCCSEVALNTIEQTPTRWGNCNVQRASVQKS